jgi:HlyD family secretion protein
MTRKKLIIGGVIVLALAGMAYANLSFNRTTGIQVTTEKIGRQDLEAIVTASGKIQPKRSVNISAETMGKVVDLQVVEGQPVTRGQLLLQIDPRNLETAVANRQANLESSRLQLAQTEAQIRNARVSLAQAKADLERANSLLAQGLLPREQYDRTVNAVETAETNVQIQEQSAQTQAQRIKQAEADLDSAKYDLNKVTVVSPIDGIVTRRNIEEGETAVVGTMNNAGTVLLTIADLSVIETEIEVDETDIPFISIGQPAKITIDAIPDREFPGRVTEVGNSPIQATAGATTQRATNFKVVVTIDGAVPDVRPGFTCTAVITTATRAKAVAVPIQAMTVRERIVDAEGNIVRAEAETTGRTGGRTGGAARRPTVPAEPGPGQTRKEIEGVFVAADGRALFKPVKIGIAGEKHFEVVGGLDEGDMVITGPYASVRNLREGDEVKATTAGSPAGGASNGVRATVGSGS